jgi:hypothetical protein
MVFPIDIPSDTSSWNTLTEILPQLLTMKRELTHTARSITSSIRDQSPSPATSFNRSSIPPVNENTGWLPETWHSPPVFVDVPVRVNDPSTSNAPDIYGYIKVNENEYYNIYTKKTVEKPPVHQS